MFFRSLRAGGWFFAFFFNLFKFILYRLWFLFDDDRLRFTFDRDWLELNTLFLWLGFSHIGLLSLLLFYNIPDIRNLAGTLHIEALIFLYLAGVGSGVMRTEVLVAVKARVLGGFGQYKGVVFERNRLDHVDRQQMVQGLLVEHLQLHFLWNTLKQMLTGFERPQKVFARDLHSLQELYEISTYMLRFCFNH